MEYEEIQEILEIRILFLEGVLSMLYSIDRAYSNCKPGSSIFSLISSCIPLKKRTWLVCPSGSTLQCGHVPLPFRSDFWQFRLLLFLSSCFIQQHSKVRSWLWSYMWQRFKVAKGCKFCSKTFYLPTDSRNVGFFYVCSWVLRGSLGRSCMNIFFFLIGTG